MSISEQEHNIIKQDSVRHIQDTTDLQTDMSIDTLQVSDTVITNNTTSVQPVKKEPLIIDTVADGTRPEITFFDSANFVVSSEIQYTDRFPFVFTEKIKKRQLEAGESLIKSLREGQVLPEQPLKADWLIFVVLVMAALYVFISTIYKRLFNEMKKFFLFSGIGDTASRDIQVLFHWKSTIINLVSFLNIALFAYCAADFYEFIPDKIPGIIFWAICFVAIAVVITIRHIICLITGNISEEKDLFDEYIITIYHSYRYLAVILFILTIFILYTRFIPAETLFTAGLVMLALVYSIRLIRFFFIFLKKNISIFYLILYLCALEFLPVLVLMKYITSVV